MIESVDARVHLAQARPVIAAKKPLFIDKPMAASTKDAAEIVRLAKAAGVPLFSASSRRYVEDVLMLQADPKVGAVMGAATYGPATLEPHHPDLFWYGVHAVETLYQLMGPGCVSVSRTHTEGTDVVVGTWADGRVGVVRGVRSGKYSTYGQTVFGANDVVSATSEMPLPGGAKRRTGYYGLRQAHHRVLPDGHGAGVTRGDARDARVHGSRRPEQGAQRRGGEVVGGRQK